jgi:hypothetical protein
LRANAALSISVPTNDGGISLGRGDRERFDEMNREGARASLPALNAKRE